MGDTGPLDKNKTTLMNETAWFLVGENNSFSFSSCQMVDSLCELKDARMDISGLGLCDISGAV